MHAITVKLKIGLLDEALNRHMHLLTIEQLVRAIAFHDLLEHVVPKGDAMLELKLSALRSSRAEERDRLSNVCVIKPRDVCQIVECAASPIFSFPSFGAIISNVVKTQQLREIPLKMLVHASPGSCASRGVLVQRLLISNANERELRRDELRHDGLRSTIP